MQTIETLLTSPNPLLRLLIKGILELGYQNIKIVCEKRRFIWDSIYKYEVFEVGGKKVLLIGKCAEADSSSTQQRMWFRGPYPPLQTNKSSFQSNGWGLEWGQSITKTEEVIEFLEDLSKVHKDANN